MQLYVIFTGAYSFEYKNPGRLKELEMISSFFALWLPNAVEITFPTR